MQHLRHARQEGINSVYGVEDKAESGENTRRMTSGFDWASTARACLLGWPDSITRMSANLFNAGPTGGRCPSPSPPIHSLQSTEIELGGVAGSCTLRSALPGWATCRQLGYFLKLLASKSWSPAIITVWMFY